MNKDLNKQKKIMVVEDENIVAMDIEQGLKRLGYVVPIVVDNGEEAVTNAGLLSPDLVLMDIQLKGNMDGVEAANEIQNRYHIPVIFLTAFADETTLHRAKLSEPYGYLLKPFEESELHTAIEIVLHKHRKVEAVQANFIKELVLSEERFKLFIDSVYDYAIFMLDLGGNIVSWNTGAERILGYTAQEVIGKHISIFYTKEDRDSDYEGKSLESTQGAGQFLDEGWRVKKDGTKIWAHITMSALFDKDNLLLGYGKVVHDMTKTKATEEMLTNTVKARDEFLSIASHELKTPLTSLLLQTQSFQRGQRRNDDRIYDRNYINKLIEKTYRQIIRLSRLVEDMLDISRIRTGKFTMKWSNFDIKQLLKDILEHMTPQFVNANCGQPILNAPETEVTGEWDKERIEQVISNLLTNALNYASGFPVSITLKDLGENIQIEVKDLGIGIEKKNHERIFERFERAVDANKISGMGISLYISKEIVDAHQGRIWVESELGQGATFYVRIPRYSSRPAAKVAESL